MERIITVLRDVPVGAEPDRTAFVVREVLREAARQADKKQYGLRITSLCIHPRSLLIGFSAADADEVKLAHAEGLYTAVAGQAWRASE